MTSTNLWRRHANSLVQFAGLLVCCGAAWRIRALVAADTLADGTAVALQVGLLVALSAALGFAAISAMRARSVVERVVVRVVPAALLLVAAAFLDTSYADLSVSLHALTSTDAVDSATSIVLGPGGDNIRLSGELVDGAAQKLTALLAAHPQVRRIHLTSDGGLVDEGQALHRVIAAHALTTFVPDYCVSACTLAFLGGRERLMMSGARIGFHAPFEEGLFGQMFTGDATLERAAYVASGVAPDFVDTALKVAPESIWTPDATKLIAAHVVTGVVDRYRFPDSNLDGSADLTGARATVLRNFPVAGALDAWHPRTVDIVAHWYLDAYRHGWSEGRVVDGLRGMVKIAASAALAEADDETLVAFAGYLKSAIDASDSDDECEAIGAHADLVAAQQVLDEDDGDADKLAVALVTRAATHRAPDAITRLRASYRGDNPEPATIVLNGHEGGCDGLHDAYDTLLRGPHHVTAAYVRRLAVAAAKAGPIALHDGDPAH